MTVNIHTIILILFVAIFFRLFSILIHKSAIYMVRENGPLTVPPSSEFTSAVKTIESFNIISWIIVVFVQLYSIWEIKNGIVQNNQKTSLMYAIIFLITCIMYPDGINAMMNINTYDKSIEKIADIVDIEAIDNSQMRISFDLAMAVLSVLSMIIIFVIYGISLHRKYFQN